MPKPTITEKHTFFVPPGGFAGSNVVFPPEEAQHASRVLRAKTGDHVQVVDGIGGRFRVHLDVVDRRGMIGTVVETVPADRQPEVSLTLAFGMIKHSARFELILEKATELGVSRLVPLHTERTERVSLKAGRSQAILVSAMKQSGGSRLPRLDDVTDLAAFLSEAPTGRRLICHETAPQDAGIAGILSTSPSADVTVMVGPEGGFSAAEVDRAVEAGFSVCSLGPTRLRTETAAIVAAATCLLVHG